jgi:acyl-CoA thioesterase II
VSNLEAKRLASLDGLLRVLDLQPCGDDRFEAPGEPGPFPRTFGGQLLAQAVVAASRTVDGMAPSSLHAYFASPGVPSEAVELDVRRVRDGRSMATREVSIEQGERTLLTAIVSFHADVSESATEAEALTGPGPDELPNLQDWVTDRSNGWVDRPPPVEVRIAEPPVFLGGERAAGPRSHWLRLARPVDPSPALQAALLAHASDYLLMDMAFRSHPVPFTTGRLAGSSLDHSIWFHRPAQVDRWHRYTQELVTLAGERGLVRGALHDEQGHLVASTAQEVLVRVAEE